jgi:uncharacterized membrane protein
MRCWIVAYLVAGALYVAGDATWITLTDAVIYRPALGPLLADKFNLAAGAAFYLLYFIGLVAFGVAPGLRSRSVIDALKWGALFGLIAYGTYDLTNQTTLKLWSSRVTLFDMGWGTVISALASAAGCRAALWVTQP